MFFSVNDKMIEGDYDGLRTLDCLRGRLLAERATTRIANENADLMANKLNILETQLRLEIKSKNKAEKKLNFLKKRLESLKINDCTDNSDASNNSGNMESSCSSSSEYKKGDSDKGSNNEINYNASEATSSNQYYGSPSSEECSKTRNSTNFHKPESTKSCQESNINDHYSFNSSMGGNLSIEEDEHVDNTSALVLVPQKAELKMVNKSASEVLDALREAIQSTLEGKNYYKIGSVEAQMCS